MTETLGQRVRRLRRERGMSTTELAYRASVTEGAVRQLEYGSTATTASRPACCSLKSWA